MVKYAVNAWSVSAVVTCYMDSLWITPVLSQWPFLGNWKKKGKNVALELKKYWNCSWQNNGKMPWVQVGCLLLHPTCIAYCVSVNLNHQPKMLRVVEWWPEHNQ